MTTRGVVNPHRSVNRDSVIVRREVVTTATNDIVTRHNCGADETVALAVDQKPGYMAGASRQAQDDSIGISARAAARSKRCLIMPHWS